MEKRKFPRITTTAVVDIYEKGSVVSRGKAVVLDLSLGGMGLETEQILPERSDIYVKLPVTVDVLGKIVYKKPHGVRTRYGIKFSKIGFFDKQTLKKFITAKLK